MGEPTLPALRLGILASHRGSLVRAILNAIQGGQLHATIQIVISNNSQAAVFELAHAQQLPTRHISLHTHGDPQQRDAAIAQALLDAHVQLLVCAGYMKKVTEPLLTAFAGRIINIHPALLPAFGGVGLYGDRVHAAVLAAGATESGATVHLVDSCYDHGPILAQQRVVVSPHDSVQTLKQRVQQAEQALYPATIAAIARGEMLPDLRRG